jgi:hypothetical protein
MKAMDRILRLGAAALLLLLATGCAHVVNVVPSPAAIAPAEKVQADVALVLSDELKRYQHSESRMGDTWNYNNLGQASAEHFRNGLESRFRKVTVVNARPSGAAAAPYAMVVEPRIVGFTFDIPMLKFQVYPASIRYSVAAFAPNGAEVYRKDTSGVGDLAGSPGFDFAANPSKSASRAVEEGVRLSLDELLAAPPVSSLLKGNRAAPTLDPSKQL